MLSCQAIPCCASRPVQAQHGIALCSRDQRRTDVALVHFVEWQACALALPQLLLVGGALDGNRSAHCRQQHVSEWAVCLWLAIFLHSLRCPANAPLTAALARNPPLAARAAQQLGCCLLPHFGGAIMQTNLHIRPQ